MGDWELVIIRNCMCPALNLIFFRAPILLGWCGFQSSLLPGFPITPPHPHTRFLWGSEESYTGQNVPEMPADLWSTSVVSHMLWELGRKLSYNLLPISQQLLRRIMAKSWVFWALMETLILLRKSLYFYSSCWSCNSQFIVCFVTLLTSPLSPSLKIIIMPVTYWVVLSAFYLWFDLTLTSILWVILLSYFTNEAQRD